jgi:hypothetical protein
LCLLLVLVEYEASSIKAEPAGLSGRGYFWA